MWREEAVRMWREEAVRMLKADRVRFIDEKLKALYPVPPVPLDHRDPFTLLVAVLLSAQCTDERVNQVTPALFALAQRGPDSRDHPTLRTVAPEGEGHQAAQ